MKHLVPALLIALALSTTDVGGVAAANLPSPGPTASPGTPASDAGHPLVMQQAENEVAGAKLGSLTPFTPAPGMRAVGGGADLQREVFGFALLSSLSDPTIGYPSWNFSLLSTVAVFGLHVRDDGTFAPDSGYSVWSSSQMTGLMSAAHSAGTKVVVTVILQDFSAGTPHMCAGLANRAGTVAQTVAEVKAKGADGVNLDYEGLQTSCANGVNPRAAVTDLVRQLKAALPGGSYLSVDTYASSAGDPAGFFDISGINASADSFFVMAYDSDRSNYNHAPLGCSSYCLNPVSPLTGYYYNDTRAAAEYSAVVPASKVILGLPYYSRGACVASASPNQTPNGAGTWTLSYRAAASMASDSSNSNYLLHRDANDPSGMTPWSTWTSASGPPCQTEEMYWDDTTSLGQKYDLVNRDNLRGVGLWNLNLGGGSPELWSTLSTHFACPTTITVPASPQTSEFSVALSAGGCDATSFDVQQYDTTLNQGWFPVKPVAPNGGAGSAVVDGYPGYTYQFQARAHSRAGVVGAWSTGSTTVAAGASASHPFQGVYTLDGYGGVHAADSPPLRDSAYWPGWKIVRAVKAAPGATAPRSGFVLDGYGGLHPYGAPGVTETSSGGHYWAYVDIARDFAFLPDGSGGFVLDGYGGLHPFRLNGSTAPLQAQGYPYWSGWDIARKVVIFADGTGGYVLDGYGGLHPFGINGPPPANAGPTAGGGYWPGWQIVRDVVLLPGNGNHSGYVLDGYGGIHPFHSSTDGSAMPAAITGGYWSGWDIARSMWLFVDSTAAAPKGYQLDGYGGLHPLGGAPAIASSAYWPGWDIAQFVWGA